MPLIVIISGLINLAFWLILFSGFSRFRQYGFKSKDHKVWMVLVVRNEFHNLKNNLKVLLNQNTKAFNILIIDDGSSDGTYSWLQELKASNDHLHVKRFEHSVGKKHALHNSIPVEEPAYLVFTDGDCACSSSEWLNLMLSAFGENHEVVLGYAPMNKKRTWISLFARYETFLTALQYFSYALAGNPYMGVGRNLAYITDILKSTDGFSSHLDLLSGDDDLTVNAVAKKNNVGIQTDPKSFMYSDPPENLRAFVRQKSRHITTSVRYKMKHQILLAVFSFTHVVFYFSLFFIDPISACVAYAARILLILLFNYRAFVKLKETDLALWFPVLDFNMAIYYILMSFTFIFPRKKSW